MGEKDDMFGARPPDVDEVVAAALGLKSWKMFSNRLKA